MDGLATEPLGGRAPNDGASWCEECGYYLRGLPPRQPCPECGHVPPQEDDRISPHTGWGRSVFGGLVLMLLLTVYAVSCVLIQPFTEDLGGTTTALNLVGPKLWAVPLLQRPLGYSPENPGVAGTRVALLSLLAVWLVTAPCHTEGARSGEPARLRARWACMIAFGIAFGVLLASQGLGTDQMLAYRTMLVLGVELPGTAMLYLYFQQLAQRVPGRERRLAMDRLVWLVPLTIAAAGAMLGFQWLKYGNWHADPPDRVSLIVGGAYGAAGVICGVAATAAIASLACAFFTVAFPRAAHWLSAGRWLSRRTVPALLAGISTTRARRYAIATGAIICIILMVLGNDQILWMSTRRGLGGNLPFMNFPGPKVWAGALLASGNGNPYRWDPFVESSTLLMMHLLALWLVTIPLKPSGRDRLRTFARWVPIVCLGAGTGVMFGFDRLLGLEEAARSEMFAIITVLIELPSTILFYVVLGRAADELDLPRLARGFRQIAGVAMGLVVSALALFVLSRHMMEFRRTPIVLALCGVYGAASLATAAWATGGIMRLAGVLVMPHRASRAPLILEIAQKSRLASKAAH